jgi:predicted ATPase
MDSNNFIKHITLENYKSIKKLDLELKPLNVLIGSNGAGKSNLISFFNLLKKIESGQLESYTINKGGQDVFLFYGRASSSFLSAEINVVNTAYRFTLVPTDEQVFQFKNEDFKKHKWYETRNVSKESELFLKRNLGSVGYDYSTEYIKEVQTFHFHDTSDTSPLKATVANNDNLFLRADGQNLACMIKLIYDKHPEYYKMIVDTIRNVVPDFHDFVIRHNSEFLSLEWFNKNNVDIPWKAHYLSDGSLRFIALAVLLLMPSELQPQVIIIDEPEIGLHPTALNVLSGLIKRASLERQVIISTQSATLLSQFEPDDVIVVDKKDKYSEFRRLSNHDLANWLESYTLGELWETNVIGGRP